MINNRELLDAWYSRIARGINLSNLEGQFIFITGGTGIIGQSLLRALREQQRLGYTFRVMVLSREPYSFLSRYPEWRDEKWLTWLTGDVRDFYIPSEVSLVIHGAGDSHNKSLTNFERWSVSQQGANKMFEEVAQLNKCRVLLLSSGAVYGHQKFKRPICEDDTLVSLPQDSRSIYGEAKRSIETLGGIYYSEFGVEVVAARCFSFAGPVMPLNAHFAFGNFLANALGGRGIVIEGDGSPVRSFLAYPDLAYWILLILINGRAGEAYNVGSNEPVTIRELAQKIREIVNPNVSIDVLGGVEESSASSYYVPDIRKAKDELALKVWTPLEDIIKLSAIYYS